MIDTIGEYASRPVIAVESHSSVLDAMKLMSDKSISCVIALEHDEPIGILTERDIVFAANWLLGQPDLLINQVMNKPVMTASSDMKITQAQRVFRQHNIRHLVVLDARLDMAGVFTQTDLVRSLSGEAFTGITDVIELMTSKVLTVTRDVPARYALSLMARRSVSCVVVVEDSFPVGMFTERDVVRCVAEGVDLTTASVGDVMSSSIVTVPMTTAPHATISIMQEKTVRRVLVVDDLGSVAGILTQTDIGRVLDRQDSNYAGRFLGDTDGLTEASHRPL
ncbi:MAG: CBS domain-containing protein [Desulfuromonadales bacterium]|jgi:predicted transcriptional regulator